MVLISFGQLSCEKSNVLTSYSKPIESIPVKCRINWMGHWLHEGDREKLVRNLANEFEFLHQDIKVNLVFPEEQFKDENEELNYYVEQFTKKEASCDIIRFKDYYGAIANKLHDEKWGEKYLYDFSKIQGFIEKHKDFINTSQAKSSFGNMLIGPYIEGQIWALYVNTDVAKKMGITVKQYGMSYDDFLSCMKAAYEYNKTHAYIAPIFEGEWISTEVIFKRLFYSLVGNYDKILNIQFTQKKFDALRKCFEAMEELSRYNPIIRNRSKIVWNRDNDYPLKDSCLFFVNGSWMYNIWRCKAKDKMNKIMLCELPVFEPSDTYIGSYTPNWAVLKNSPHKDEAVKLLMYLCSPQVAEDWVRYTKCPTGLKGNLSSTSFGTDPFESFLYNIEQKYGSRKVTHKDNQYILGPKNYDVQLRVIDVLEGRLSAHEVLNELRKQLVY